MSVHELDQSRATADPWCTCGYRRSAHGNIRWACTSFRRSQFHNDLTLPAAWIRDAKAARRKGRSA